MERVQKTRTEATRTTETPEETVPKTKDTKIEEDKALADDLLDEIDLLLEENAETFVKEYVQRGGE